MQAGRLRHRIAIQSASESLDDFGSTTKVWSTDTTVWGHVEPLSGQEKFEAQQVVGEVTHKITTRYYSSGITPDMRLVYDSRTFEILSVIDVREHNRAMELLCKEMV